MPAKPRWLLHIPEIRCLLADAGLPVIDRAVVERLFGLGRRQAIELMHRFGGYQAGRTFLIGREQLTAQLDAMAASCEYMQEAARREKLAANLERYQRTRQAQAIRIAAPPEVFGGRLDTLGPGMRLNPGRLEVEFADAEDLLTKLFALAQAIGNDYAGFERASTGLRGRA
jgi:hypothetical protein